METTPNIHLNIAPSSDLTIRAEELLKAIAGDAPNSNMMILDGQIKGLSNWIDYVERRCESKIMYTTGTTGPSEQVQGDVWYRILE